MQGVTLHAGGEVPVGAAHRSLEHSDVDSLFTKNQALRWVLIDEVGMISDNLLGTFELNISDAALHCRFSHGSDKKIRPAGGYNLLTFGDLYQIPPIPASAALCIPSADGKSQQERAALNLFWSTNPPESFNFFAELKVQKRVVGDLWYASFLKECRFGRLSDENYNFLLGLPTLHAGCWPFFKEYQCQTPPASKRLGCLYFHFSNKDQVVIATDYFYQLSFGTRSRSQRNCAHSGRINSVVFAFG